MSRLTLVMNPDEIASSGKTVLWRGRSDREDVISLESALEERLITIRNEHALWAYKTGEVDTGGGITLQSRLECGESPSMWWTSLIYERHPKLSPELYPIYKLRRMEMLLAESGCTELTIMGGDSKLRATLARLCASMGIRCTKGKGGKIPVKTDLKHRLYAAVPAPARALIRLAHWWWTIWRKLPTPERLAPYPGGDKRAATIATYFPNIDLKAAGEGRFRSRYWEKLHELLNGEAQKEHPDGPHFVRWLLIRFPAPELDFQECIRMRNLFQQKGADGVSFNFLEEFISAGDITAALGRWFKLCLQSMRMRGLFARNCKTAGSKLNFWPLMRAQWNESMAGWRSLERCLFNRAFRNYCRLAGPQRWTLLPLENCPWERMLTIAARRIPDTGSVYGAQHSTIRPTDFRYFDAPQTFSAADCAAFQPDIIAGNGAGACGQWRANGMPDARLRQVEALRYLYLARTDSEPPAVSELPPEPGEPLEAETRKRLLILTSFFADETKAHLTLVRKALDAKLLEEFQLVLKPHPYLMPEKWLAALPARQRSKIFVSHRPLSLELRPGTIVWAANSTTASLEAVLKGLPVMVMAADNDFDLCPIQDLNCLARTGTINDVARCLGHLEPLRLPPDYLDLNPDLPAWRKLLGLDLATANGGMDYDAGSKGCRT